MSPRETTPRNRRLVVDGGYGWVVVAASFMCHALVDGCVVSVGVVYTHLLDHFEESKSKTALVGSLFVGFALLFGTLSSILVERFGCRAVTILGGTMATGGYFASTFAPSINVLCFTYGTVAATGISIVSVPALVIVSAYFEKKRALALGIALCGTGVGTLVFPPACEQMIQQYGWRGMMILMSGVVLHFIVGGALFRPQPFTEGSEETVTEKDWKSDQKNGNGCLIPANGRPSVHAVRTNKSLIIPGTGSSDEEVLMVYSSCRIDTAFGSTPALARADCKAEQLPEAKAKSDSTSCPELSAHALSNNKCTGDMKPRKIGALRQALCMPFVSVYEIVLTTKTGWWLVLFLLHNFVLFFWIDVPYVFLVDKAVLMGIDPTSASFLLSIVGILDTIGQVVYGALADRRFIHNTVLYGLSIMCSGLVVGVFPLCTTFVTLALASGLFGFFVSANYTLCSVLLIEHLGQRTIAVTCGILMMCQGVGNLAGPPVAGMMFDVLGRYDEAFYVAGAFTFLSVVPTLALYVGQRHSSRRKSGQAVSSETNETGEATVSALLAPS